MKLDPRIIPGIKIDNSANVIVDICKKIYGINSLQGRKSLVVACRILIIMLVDKYKGRDLNLKEIASISGVKNHATVLHFKNKYGEDYTSGKNPFYHFIYLNAQMSINGMKMVTNVFLVEEVINNLDLCFFEKEKAIEILLFGQNKKRKLENKAVRAFLSFFGKFGVRKDEAAHFLNINISTPLMRIQSGRKKDVIIIEKVMISINKSLKAKLYEKRKNSD